MYDEEVETDEAQPAIPDAPVKQANGVVYPEDPSIWIYMLVFAIRWSFYSGLTLGVILIAKGLHPAWSILIGLALAHQAQLIEKIKHLSDDLKGKL